MRPWCGPARFVDPGQRSRDPGALRPEGRRAQSPTLPPTTAVKHFEGSDSMFKRTNAWLAALGLLIVAAAGFAARGLVAQPPAEAQSTSSTTSADAAFVEVTLDELTITP